MPSLFAIQSHSLPLVVCRQLSCAIVVQHHCHLPPLPSVAVAISHRTHCCQPAVSAVSCRCLSPPVHCTTAVVVITHCNCATFVSISHCDICQRPMPLPPPLSINCASVHQLHRCQSHLHRSSHAEAHLPLSNCTTCQGACGLAAARRKGGGHGSGWRANGRRLIK